MVGLMIRFRNTEYKSEWNKFVGSSKKEYADGICVDENGKYAVYDGAENFMGYINKDGTFGCAGALTTYRASFLRTAKAELEKQGLIKVLVEV